MDVEDGRSARLRDGIQPMGHVTITIVLQHKRAGFPCPFLDFGACFWSKMPSRLMFLAMGISVWICRGCPHLSFLFSARGGHATVASLTLCLAACPQCTQTETWWPGMTCVFLSLCAFTMSNLRRFSCISDASYRPCTTWSLPEIISVPCITYFQKQKKKHSQILGKQGVAPSFWENVWRHVTEVEEDHMDVDDVAPTGCGMLWDNIALQTQ